ncbi:hypothetical protein JCM6882_000200 [Rhodosporidiobolus microsporus]
MEHAEMDMSIVTVKAVREDGSVVACELALVDEKGMRRSWQDFKQEVEEELLDGVPALLSRTHDFAARITAGSWTAMKPYPVLWAKPSDGAASPSVPSTPLSSADLHRHAPNSPYHSPAVSPATSRRTSIVDTLSDDADSYTGSFATAPSATTASSTARPSSQSRQSSTLSTRADSIRTHVAIEKNPFSHSGRFSSLSGGIEDAGAPKRAVGHSPSPSRSASRERGYRYPHGQYDSRSASEESIATPAEGEPLPSSRSGSSSGSKTSALQGIEAALAGVDFGNGASRARKVKTCGNLNRGYSSSSPTHSRAPSPARSALTASSTSTSTSSSYTHLPSLLSHSHLPSHLTRNERPSSPHPLAPRNAPPPPGLRSVSTHAGPLRSSSSSSSGTRAVISPATSSGSSSATNSPPLSPHPRVPATTAPWINVTSQRGQQ